MDFFLYLKNIVYFCNGKRDNTRSFSFSKKNTYQSQPVLLFINNLKNKTHEQTKEIHLAGE